MRTFCMLKGQPSRELPSSATPVPELSDHPPTGLGARWTITVHPACAHPYQYRRPGQRYAPAPGHCVATPDHPGSRNVGKRRLLARPASSARSAAPSPAHVNGDTGDIPRWHRHTGRCRISRTRSVTPRGRPGPSFGRCGCLQGDSGAILPSGDDRSVLFPSSGGTVLFTPRPHGPRWDGDRSARPPQAQWAPRSGSGSAVRGHFAPARATDRMGLPAGMARFFAPARASRRLTASPTISAPISAHTNDKNNNISLHRPSL